MDRIIVGMSGGVDSAVAASILIDKGFEVEALFMKNWEEDSEFCTSENDYNDALQGFWLGRKLGKKPTRVSWAQKSFGSRVG